MALIGDNAPYDCFDIRDYLGARFSLTDNKILDEIQATATQTALGDDRVSTLRVDATFAQGVLSLSAQIQGSNGPFSLVLSIGTGTAPILSVNGVLIAG
jgi:hypothetical protein